MSAKATRIRDTPENRKSACYSFQFNRRCNRTALVVARTLHRLHRIRTYVYVERQCLRRMDTIQRQALLTETLKLYKSGIFVQVFAPSPPSPFLPLPLPSPIRPSFLHEFQLASRRSKQERRRLVWCWKRVKKRQTLHRGLIRKTERFSFLFRIFNI